MLVAAGPHRDQQGHCQGAVATHYVGFFTAGLALSLER